MFWKISKLTLIIFVLSLVLYQNVSFADKLSNTYEKDQLQIKLRDLDGAETRLTRYKSALSSLIGKWSANESKIKSGTEVSLSGAFATTASALASALSKSTPITAVAGGILTLKKAVEVGLAISARGSYVSAMSTTDSAVATAVQNINTAYEAYKTQYDKYLGMMATHLGVTKASLDMSVNTTPTNTGPYYHDTSFKHSVNPRRPKTDWDTDDAPHDYECEGSCSDMFRSPYRAFIAHRQKCGTSTSHSTDAFVLEQRSVTEGCGEVWYSCDSDHEDEAADHKIWWCVKDFIDQNGVEYHSCGHRFRKCMKKVFDHNLSDIWPALFSKHSEVEDSSTTETTQDQFIQPTPTPTPAPSMHVCSVHATSVSGDHSAASCGTSGHYACDSNNHSAASCGISGHYTCNSVEHVSLTCPTDTNGQSCDYGSYYACSPHTHVYPSAPEPPSNPNEATCINGHTYNPNNSSANNRHRTKTCRFEECGQSWANCSGNAPICNKPYRKANGLRCWAID